MRMHRLYVAEPLSSPSELTLDGDTAHYLIKVLRVSVGQSLQLFNGDGVNYFAQVLELQKKSLLVNITDCECPNNEPSLAVSVAFSLFKAERVEWLLQKGTELGATEFVPIISQYTDGKNAQQLEKKQARWQQIIISACEQSGRAVVPVLQQSESFRDFLQTDSSDAKLLLHPYQSKKLSEFPLPLQRVTLLAGPEGGFSEAEVDEAKASGFRCLSLGPRILRAETAPLSALSIVMDQWS